MRLKSTLLLPVLLIAVLITFANGCEESHLQGVIPDCIENRIGKIKAKAVQNPPVEVWKWQTERQTYFYITSGCCDQYNYLYDAQCNEVCAPDGGITGKGDGKCPKFDGEIARTLVWKDNR